MFRTLFFAASFAVAAVAAQAQDIDVQHYRFHLKLSDSTDRIEGEVRMDILFPQETSGFTLDLVGPKGNKGMTVTEVASYANKKWRQEGDKIRVDFDHPVRPGQKYLFLVKYSGIPADGLIISKNRHGERTFFADNWPNRAHHWIPCNDRPDDKASFEFIVSAPKHYAVVSNGLQQPGSGDDKGLPFRSWFWKEDVPQPTKVMVIGAARFATKTFADSPDGVPVSAWVYPQDSTKGFYDYALAPSIVKFFSDYIAPFPYQKLANVQSKTIFGGMENASAIFYAEESVTGDRKWEDVIAHEIAHQWFGDMASEKSFAHLWLSEGFATYMTNLYFERKYGVDTLRKRLIADRRQVSEFAKSSKSAVVDSTSNLMSLLNANSYQKGGWVLHMLRRQVGDTAFRKIIQTYYERYKGKNAETGDLERIASEVSGENMAWFFNQWLYRPGVPVLSSTLKKEGDKMKLEIRQEGELYRFPLEIEVEFLDGNVSLYTIPVSERVTEFKIKNSKVRRVTRDPYANLLFRQK
ncbi:MAG: M1 family peptidase [Chitinophagaceae bacterium]|nr:MAG: M1 family peptidase [Chitinophagaceae bacterium]